jgi:hypothetical protein
MSDLSSPITFARSSCFSGTGMEGSSKIFFKMEYLCFVPSLKSSAFVSILLKTTPFSSQSLAKLRFSRSERKAKRLSTIGILVEWSM